MKHQIPANDSDIRALPDANRSLLARGLKLLETLHKGADRHFAAMPDGEEKDKMRARLVHAMALRFATSAFHQSNPTEAQLEALRQRIGSIGSFINRLATGARPLTNSHSGHRSIKDHHGH